MLDKRIIAKIEEKFGKEVRYKTDIDYLSDDIKSVTGERLSRSTLERLFGHVGLQVTPRKITQDTIAVYLGYKNYEKLAEDYDLSVTMSDFADFEEVVSADLETGAQLQFTYDPERLFVVTYLGDNWFIVNEVYGSKNIQKGDKLRITHLMLHHELIIADIERNGQSLGSYKGAKQGGLTSIEIFN